MGGMRYLTKYHESDEVNKANIRTLDELYYFPGFKVGKRSVFKLAKYKGKSQEIYMK